MDNKNSVNSFLGLFRELGAVLATPITITGRPMSPEELRRKRAARARRRLTRTGRRLPKQYPEHNLSQFAMNGILKPGTGTPFAIDGHDFETDDGTWVVGDLRHGSIARVKGVIDAEGNRVARSISIITDASTSN